jgi:hypothetical protein
MPEYVFGPERCGERPHFRVQAVSLKRAIAIFRLTCLYPHTYSTAPIVAPDEDVTEPQKRYHKVARSSQLGAKVQVSTRKRLPVNPEGYQGQRDHEGNPWPATEERMVVVAEIDPTDDTYEILDRPAITRMISGDVGEGPSAPVETALTAPGGSVAPYAGMNRNALATQHTELERKLNELERWKRDLQMQVSALQAELKLRMEQVWWVELFLGSQEEVHLLRDGRPADEDTPITVHQRVVYMDEEIAIYDVLRAGDGQFEAFDFHDLNRFDNWLLEVPGALDSVLPEPKGMVVIQPRRRHLERHTGNPFADAAAAEADEQSYFLIRNGERLFRLWIDAKITRVFPTEREYEKGPWPSYTVDGEGNVHEKPRPMSDEEMQRRAKTFMPGMLVLWGLLQRSDLFHPLPPVPGGLNPFQPAHVHRYFRLVRDDETAGLLLSDGRAWEGLKWKEYREWLIFKIIVGTRVLWSGNPSDLNTRVPHGRRAFDTPSLDEVYTITEVPDHKNNYYRHNFRFMYFPSEWAKTRTTFGAYSDEVFPLDLVSVRCLETILRDRGQRDRYMQFFPVLRAWILQARAERRRERPFVSLVLQQAGLTDPSTDDRARVERLVRWWKLKVKENRTLAEDEPKALRMILAAFRRGDDYDDDPEKGLMEALRGARRTQG